MTKVTHESVRIIVQNALDSLDANPLGLKLANDGIHEVDGRWWAVIDTSVDTPDRTRVWDAIAQLEEMIEAKTTAGSGVQVLVTAA